MGIYTVHMKGNLEEPSVAERAVFVHERFGWAAFFFGPIWLIWHRAWFALTIWLFVQIALAFTIHLTLLHPAAQSGLEFLLALALGLEATSIRTYVLRRRGFKLIDVVHERHIRDAEKSFFSRWMPPARETISPSIQAVRPDLVGLFPSAGA
jgi:hypothetical protein